MKERLRFAPGAHRYALARRRQRPLLHGLVLGLISVGILLALFFPKALSFHSNETATISGLSVPNIGVSRQDQAVLTSSVLTDTVRRDNSAQGLGAVAGGTSTPQDAGGAGVPLRRSWPRRSAKFSLYAPWSRAIRPARSQTAMASIWKYLLAANSDLRDGESIAIGQMLIIPAGNGALYPLRYGETLSDVAARFDVSVADILNWPGNGITSADQVSANQLVFVPGAITASEAAPAPASATDTPPVSVSAPPIDSSPPVAAAEGQVPISG